MASFWPAKTSWWCWSNVTPEVQQRTCGRSVNEDLDMLVLGGTVTRTLSVLNLAAQCVDRVLWIHGEDDGPAHQRPDVYLHPIQIVVCLLSSTVRLTLLLAQEAFLSYLYFLNLFSFRIFEVKKTRKCFLHHFHQQHAAEMRRSSIAAPYLRRGPFSRSCNFLQSGSFLSLTYIIQIYSFIYLNNL
jgi:hypothetical protein